MNLHNWLKQKYAAANRAVNNFVGQFGDVFVEEPSPEVARDSVRGLDCFVQQLYWGDGLSPEKARTCIRNGLVEIVVNGKHSCNGLLITNNGYFLTAKHCLDDLKNKKIRLQNGLACGIERVCAYDNLNDVCLGKAAVSDENTSRTYRIFQSKLEKGMPIALITLWNGILNFKNGFIGNSNPKNIAVYKPGEQEYYHHHFTVKYNSIKKGDSGGVLATYDGCLIGLNCWVELNEKGAQTELSGGVKFMRALELVHAYKQECEKALKCNEGSK